MAKLRVGGDMALEALPQARRPTARVQTVDLFAGPVKLDAKGNARIDLPVPDFNGTLRVSALVYSAAATAIATSKPWCARRSWPRPACRGSSRPATRARSRST